MVLEAIEDFDRGYRPGGKQYAGMRVPRSGYWIEHIMPQNWEASWPAPTEGTLQERAQRIQTLGNLTLLTDKLNIRVADGPWTGVKGKKAALLKHDLLLLNRDLDAFSPDGWSDESITNRTAALIKKIIEIWSVPPGYKSSAVRDASLSSHSVSVSDLISAGLLSVGLTIIPQALNLREHMGHILSDGRIDVDGRVFDKPSGAAYYLRKRSTNGWTFWLVDRETKKSLASVRREYLEQISLDSKAVDDDDDEGDGDDLATA